MTSVKLDDSRLAHLHALDTERWEMRSGNNKRMVALTFKIPCKQLEAIDYLVYSGKLFVNKSEFIRNAIRHSLVDFLSRGDLFDREE